MTKLESLVSVAVSIAPSVASAENGSSSGAAGRILFGATLGLVGMFAVFAGLLAVYATMRLTRRLGRHPVKKERPPSGTPGALAVATESEISAEVVHAIALALYMDLQAHADGGSEEITLKRITKAHSGWWFSRQSVLVNENEAVSNRWKRQ